MAEERDCISRQGGDKGDKKYSCMPVEICERCNSCNSKAKAYLIPKGFQLKHSIMIEEGEKFNAI